MPLPLEPAVTVNQPGALLAAVHEQPADVVSDVELLPPVATTDVLVGFNANVQPAAAWFTVKVWPPIVTVPCRVCVAVFADALNVIVPLPLPLPPALTVNQLGALLVAVQEQPAGAPIDVATVPPLAPTEPLTGVSAYVQGAAAWFTVNVCPPIVNVPCRVCVAEFSVAENDTVPLPLPLAPAVTVSQPDALLVAVHAHPAGAVTAVDPLPPVFTTDALIGDSE